MLFISHGRRYTFRVSKEQNKTCLHGTQWDWFIEEKKICVGDILVFSMIPRPTIYVVIIGDAQDDSLSSEDDSISSEDDSICSEDGNSDDEMHDEDSNNSDDEVHDEDSDNSDDERHDDANIVYAQRANLENHEKNRLARLLPIGPYVGLPFVTRFTVTSLQHYNMVCTYKMPSSFCKLIFKNHEKVC